MNFCSRQSISDGIVFNKKEKYGRRILKMAVSMHFDFGGGIKGLVISKGNSVWKSDDSRWEFLQYMCCVLLTFQTLLTMNRFFKLWSDGCLEDVFVRGNKEAETGLPMNFDRRRTQKANSQIDFIFSFVIKSAHENLGLVIPWKRRNGSCLLLRRTWSVGRQILDTN